MLKAASVRRGLMAGLFVTTALSPAYAHDSAGDSDISRKLSDPMTQAGVAAVASAAVGALLSVDISPLAKAMGTVDPDARDIPLGTTLGDIAGRDTRDLPHDIARRTPQAMGALAHMMGSVEAMRPQI